MYDKLLDVFGDALYLFVCFVLVLFCFVFLTREDPG
jgi:hypothetical protein